MANKYPQEVPQIEVTLFTVPADMVKQAFEVMAMVWNGKPAGEKAIENTDTIAFVASYLSFYTGHDFKAGFKECRITLKTEVLQPAVLTGWKMLFEGKEIESLTDRHILLVNNMLLLLLCAKQPTEANYREWSINRAKTILGIYKQEWKSEYQQYLLSYPWAKAVSYFASLSLSIRTELLSYVFERVLEKDYNMLAFRYVLNMLRFARLTTILITRLYITSDPNQKILLDPYLSADREAWLCALRTLEKYPLPLRPYAGIIADGETASLLGGQQLHNITYIALVVGARKQESLNNFVKPDVPHQAKLDELIRKYFPDDVEDYPLGNRDDIEDIDLIGSKPLELKSLARFANVIGENQVIKALRDKPRKQKEVVEEVENIYTDADDSLSSEDGEEKGE